MAYIDGFLVPVPVANQEAYRKMAADFVPMFKEFGGTRVVECWGDDVPAGQVTDMHRAVKATGDETVVFSWIEYPDRATRDAAGIKMRSDPRMKDMNPAEMPFDGMRMIYGGFQPLIDEGVSGGATYMEGSVAPAVETMKAVYQEHATRVAAALLKLGALHVVEAWGDDVPDGKVTDFKGSVNGQPGEAIVFSFIEWPSKAVRDAAWPQIMSDPSLAPPQTDVPAVDNQRRIFGGFVPIVDA